MNIIKQIKKDFQTDALLVKPKWKLYLIYTITVLLFVLTGIAIVTNLYVVAILGFYFIALILTYFLTIAYRYIQQKEDKKEDENLYE